MPNSDIKAESRRRFLKFMSGSPLLAWPGFAALAAEDPIRWAPMRAEDLITSPKDALNVFDFEPVARKNIPPAHFGYMASGIDDEVTLRANREGFLDRKSTRLNSSHLVISYAVFCLKKKKKI